MPILNALFALIERLKRHRVVQLFAIYLRYLIGGAFVFAGLPKALGERFTQLPVETPVGFYFEAMYRSGFYWNFLGWGQVVAAALLMTQRFASLGAVLFFPIIVNIWLVTWSIGFQGTPAVTFLMFLAAVWLLLWDYRKLWPLLLPESRLALLPSDFDDRFMRLPIWVVLGTLLIACVVALRLDFAHARVYLLLGFGLALTGLVFGFSKKMPVGQPLAGG